MWGASSEFGVWDRSLNSRGLELKVQVLVLGSDELGSEFRI